MQAHIGGVARSSFARGSGAAARSVVFVVQQRRRARLMAAAAMQQQEAAGVAVDEAAIELAHKLADAAARVTTRYFR